MSRSNAVMRRAKGVAGRPGAPVSALGAALAALVLAACQTVGGDAPAGGGATQLSLQARLRLAEATDAQQGGTAATYAVLSEAAAAAPNDIPLQERLAALAEANERWDEAAAALRRVVARAPTQDRLMRLGRLELRLGQSAAVETWRRAAAAGARTVEVLNGLGMAHDLTGDHVAAQAVYREALSLDPGNWTVAANLGMSLMLSRQPAAAVDALARAENDPSAPARARHNLAIALAMAGQEARMLRLLRSDSGRTQQQTEVLAAEVRDFARWLATRDAATGEAAPPTSAPAQAAQAPTPAGAATEGPPRPITDVAADAAAAARAAGEVRPDPAQPTEAAAGRSTLPPGPVVRMEPIVNPRDPQARAEASPPARPAVTDASAPAPLREPAVARRPEEVPASPQGAAIIQLGALESEATAQRQWAVLSSRVAELAAHSPSIERFDTNGRTVWRLRVRGLASLAEANDLCGRVRAAGGTCFATR